MTFRQSLYVVRRWRSVIVAGVLIGAVVGWLSADGAPPRTTTFEAVHTLLLRSEVKGIGAVARFGAVPNRVAGRLGIDRRVVQSNISVYRPPGLGTVVIVAHSADPVQAEALANATAEELIVELGGPNGPLRTLEPAVASPMTTGDVQAPRSRPGRALLLAAFGLVLGFGAALVVDRFDDRVRSRQAAEGALGVPVMAQIPAIDRTDREQALAAVQSSAFIEAYRGLRTSVERWTSGHGDDRPVIVITSPIGGEGATTTAAHLAASLGEIGRSVVVISADLRQPRLHLFFNRAAEPGLTDLLRGAPDVRKLTDLNLATTTRGVQFVASGAPVRNPAPLLDRLGGHLHEARSLGDLVLIDAPPLLTTSDGADLARQADGVLLVVRSGRTSVKAAARTAELLDRLKIPVVGAVLVDSDGTAVRT